jgi:multicomponent Na+:H+ antiporter subunit D
MVLCGAILPTSLLAIVYVWRGGDQAYFTDGDDTTAPNGSSEAPAWMLVVTWAGVGANVYFGVQPEVPLSLARATAATLIGTAP